MYGRLRRDQRYDCLLEFFFLHVETRNQTAWASWDRRIRNPTKHKRQPLHISLQRRIQEKSQGDLKTMCLYNIL